MDQALGLVGRQVIEAVELHFLGGKRRQRIALVQPERLVLDAQVARLLVEGVDVAMVAEDEFTHGRKLLRIPYSVWLLRVTCCVLRVA